VVHPAELFSSERSIGTALRETYRMFCRALNRRLLPEGVTLGMWFVLRELWAEDGLSQTVISRRTATHAPALVGIVNSLERAGLVQRRLNTKDKRVSCVFLTARGKLLEARLTPAGLCVNSASLAGFSAAEVTMLLGALTRLRANLAADEERWERVMPGTRNGTLE
jgi:DNA-binding MarR family transcriptional regulator